MVIITEVIVAVIVQTIVLTIIIIRSADALMTTKPSETVRNKLYLFQK